jgi:5-methylcytosine-specific restriction endonuclease McrA
MLETGNLTLCSIAEISKIINQENAASLLEQTQGLSKRKTEALVVKQLPPAKVKRETIRKVAVTPSLPPVKTDGMTASLFDQPQSRIDSELPKARERELPPVVVTSYSFLGDQEFDDLVNQVVVHTGRKTLVEILKTAMRSYLKERVPKTGKVRSFNLGGRYIPKHVRQSVIERDQGQCCFVSENGVRCTSKAGLQIDHIAPFAKGGLTELSNLRTLCSAHNLYEAERAFGREKIYFHQRNKERRVDRNQ